MIQHVYEKCKLARNLTNVYVATDDDRIAEVVSDFGGKYIMTSKHHENGTERCNEAAMKIFKDIEFDFVVNIQGDEPFINPLLIDNLVDSLASGIQIATAIKKISDNNQILDSNVVKVVFNKLDEAMYFSRLPIPFFRGLSPNQELIRQNDYYKHIGIYAFQKDILSKIVNFEISNYENSEKLEQLRWLENGLKIKVIETEFESFGIDTPDDLAKINISSTP